MERLGEVLADRYIVYNPRCLKVSLVMRASGKVEQRTGSTENKLADSGELSVTLLPFRLNQLASGKVKGFGGAI